ANFKVTAVGGQVRLKKITFQVSWTDTTTNTASLLSLSNFKLYRNGSPVDTSLYSIFDGTGTATGDELSPGGTATLTSDNMSGQDGISPNSTSTYATLLFGVDASGIDSQAASGDTGSGEEVIDVGTSNTYELKIDVANAHVGASTDSDSITVQLLGDDAETANLTQRLAEFTGAHQTVYRYGVVSLNGTNYNFLWSDYSANTGDHDSTFIQTGQSQDWTHGYQVPSSSGQSAYVPLDSWVLSKS
ncbi:MAG: hypothetical protein HYW81_02305, partial [Parcubacteria group bacterium]|nr:hypothetical protein [Parcubacteria group bacterium]